MEPDIYDENLSQIQLVDELSGMSQGMSNLVQPDMDIDNNQNNNPYMMVGSAITGTLDAIKEGGKKLDNTVVKGMESIKKSIGDSKTGQFIGDAYEATIGKIDLPGITKTNKAGETVLDMGNISNYLAGASAVANYGQSIKGYDSAIDNIEESLRGMNQARADIGSLLSDDIGNIRSDSSDLNVADAVSSLDKIKSSVRKVDQMQGDFVVGDLQAKKDELLANVNSKLKSVFDKRKMKSDELIRRSINRASSVTDRLESSEGRLQDELNQIKDAKKNQFRNTLTDLAAVGSRFYDPTGISAEVIKSTKYKNKYTG